MNRDPRPGLPMPRPCLRILVIEADPAPAEAIRRVLEAMAGVELRVLASLGESQDRAAAWQPDLALVDLAAGQASGFLAGPERCAFPVIILTSGGEQNAVAALQSGALDYLVKSPETFAALPHTIERALREWQGRTERRRAEQALREAHQFSQMIISSAQEGVTVLGPDLRYLVWNPHMEQLTGLPADRVLGRHPLDLFPFMGVTGALDSLQQALTGAAPAAMEVPYYIPATGKTGWIHHSCSPFRNTGGEIIGVIGMVADITGRKRAEHDLQASEARFRDLYEASPLPLLEVDFSDVRRRFTDLGAAGVTDLRAHLKSHPGELHDLATRIRILDANPASLRLVGAVTLDAISRNFPALFTQSSIGAFREEMGVLFDGQVTYKCELALHTLDSKLRYLYMHLSVLPGHEASLDRVLVSLLDLTERKRNAQALLESEFFFRESQRAAAVGSYKADFVLDLWKSSEVLDHILGIGPKYHRSIEGWLALVHPEDRPRMERHLREDVMVGLQAFSAEYRIIRRNDGATRWVRGLGRGAFGPSGDMLSLSGTIQDITERKLAELALQGSEERYRAQLEQQVKERTAELEAANRELEAFSYSVSHDLRAPLRSVDGFSQILLEDFQDQLDPTGRSHLARIRKGAQRMGQLIDDLLKLSQIHRQSLNREELDLSSLCARVAGDLAQADPARTVELNIHQGMCATGDARLLRVMLDNLLGNAWKFTGKHQNPRIEVGERCLPGGERAFFVQDNGAGFDMAQAPRLFKAFQRLHSADQFDGTGIGLAIVQRIVHRHRGRIWAEAEPGQGATFHFTLPDEDSSQN